MNYLNPIYTEKTQCQDCYKCIRECPVKAIRVENGHAAVISSLCVLCGHCVTVCPAGAKRVRDDLGRARQLLKLKDKVIVSLAPSFASEFAGIPPETLVEAIKSLGFFGVSETAIGADLVSARLAEDFALARGKIASGLESDTKRLYLSSACPSAVEYVKRYLPEYERFITDRASPLLAHSRYLRQIYGADIGVVFVGPCIAKKREADVWQTVDAAISFAELAGWMNDAGIDPGTHRERHDKNSENGNGFIPFRASSGSLYGVDGGMIASAKKFSPSAGVHMMSVTGLGAIDAAIRGLKNEDLEVPLFLELLACPGGCVNGPLVSSKRPSSLRRIRLLEYAQNAPVESAALFDPVPELAGTLPIERPVPLSHSEDELRSALKQVGKLTIADELNCGSCGYDTCRLFVAAMLENRAEKTMCVSYMRKLAQKKANGLIKAIPSGVVICDSSMKIVECNENFARLMGSDIESMYEAKPGMEGADLEAITGMARFFRDVMTVDGPDVVEHEFREGKKIFHATVFSIEKGESSCGVIQDVTAPQVQRDRVIRQTRKVIDKNLAVVQKIAFLLGENAAETEATLNSIIESFSAIDEDDA